MVIKTVSCRHSGRYTDTGAERGTRRQTPHTWSPGQGCQEHSEERAVPSTNGAGEIQETFAEEGNCALILTMHKNQFKVNERLKLLEEHGESFVAWLLAMTSWTRHQKHKATEQK